MDFWIFWIFWIRLRRAEPEGQASDIPGDAGAETDRQGLAGWQRQKAVTKNHLRRHTVSKSIWNHWIIVFILQVLELFVYFYFSLFIIIYHYLSLFIIICHYLSLFIIIYQSLIIIIRIMNLSIDLSVYLFILTMMLMTMTMTTTMVRLGFRAWWNDPSTASLVEKLQVEKLSAEVWVQILPHSCATHADCLHIMYCIYTYILYTYIYIYICL